MPSSSVRTFTDPGEYATALPHASVNIVVKRPGVFTAKLTSIDFHRLWIQSLSEDLPRTSYNEMSAERAFVVFQTRPGPAVVRDGVETSTKSITRLRLAQTFYQHTSGPTSLTAMSLPVDEIALLGAAITGCDLTPPNNSLTITPTSDAMERLHRLHKAAADLAEDAPAVLTQPEAAHGLEQALIEAVIHCVDSGEAQEDRSAQRHHAAIMRRFDRVIEEHLNQPLYVPELCKEVGASQRTLLACCQEHLGMGPKRYLLLRRMHMVRRALHESTPAESTVTDVATRYGFWQFGRFAGEYKALFGEAPSATLARST